AKGAVGYITTTSSPILAPPGGKKPVVGNNPIAWAVPRRAPNPPIVLDMALSQVAFGRIRLAAAEGRPIPLGWAYDSRGLPTTDAAEALRTGLLAPVGGHKGYGLSVISELLAGVMTGSPFGLQSDAHSRRQGGVGHLLIAIRPDFFLDLETFYDGVEELVAQIKAVPLAEGANAVYLPGEIEWNTEQVRRREGIPISDELAHKLGSLAQRLGVEVPAWS
ncbi:MAG TPA: Ldh family oxidoreductase, partial [Bacillota bacterium]